MPKHTAVLLFATLAIVGCDRQQEPLTGVAPEFSQTGQVVQQGHDLDSEWARVAQTEVPGFAGYFRSESGEYVVAVSTAARSEQAKAFVRSILASAGKGDRPIRIRIVQHSFDRLKAWKDALTPLVDGRDVYWLDIDESVNKLVFGVKSYVSRDEIVRAAVSAGIPAAAVELVQSREPEERSTVRDYLRPVQGGLQLAHVKSGWTYLCTLGVNATLGSKNGFVTASHCSSTKFGPDGTVQYQNDVLSSYRIGTENIDPSSGRDSDAAYYVYDSGVNRDWGHIARTLYPTINQAGPLTIDASNPRFRITSEAANSVQVTGELVSKVGRTSGWTQGQVTRTCVTLENLPCQWEALVWSEGGDSGSPMFKQSASNGNHVALWGILWGGPAGDWTTTWYSPISGVNNDLGSLAIACDPAASECYPPVYAAINGPSTIKRAGTYTWSAMANHGDGTYTYRWQERQEGSSTWYDIGTGTSVTRYVDASNYPGFDLRLTVTSAGKSGVDEMQVNVLILEV